MRLILYTMGIFALFIIQTSFFGQFRIWDVMPNLFLIAIILNGLHATASSTVAMALGGGLLMDMASGHDFGVRIAFFTLAALAVVVVRQLGLQLEGLGMVGLLTVIGTLAFDVIVVAGVGMAGIQDNVIAVAHLTGMEIVINCVIISVGHLILVGLGSGANRGEPGMRKRTILQGR